jgi:hypothetical protein
MPAYAVRKFPNLFLAVFFPKHPAPTYPSFAICKSVNLTTFLNQKPPRPFLRKSGTFWKSGMKSTFQQLVLRGLRLGEECLECGNLGNERLNL